MDLTMQKLKNIEEKELHTFLSDLKILKQKGELDTDEKLEQQDVKWRNTLEYCVLESCVRHYSKEVTVYLQLTNNFLLNEIYIVNNICLKNFKKWESQLIKE